MLKVVSNIYYKLSKITFYIFFFYMGLNGINFEYICNVKPFLSEQVSVKVRKVKLLNYIYFL